MSSVDEIRRELEAHMAESHDESAPRAYRDFLSLEGLRDAHTIAHGHERYPDHQHPESMEYSVDEGRWVPAR